MCVCCVCDLNLNSKNGWKPNNRWYQQVSTRGTHWWVSMKTQKHWKHCLCVCVCLSHIHTAHGTQTHTHTRRLYMQPKTAVWLTDWPDLWGWVFPYSRCALFSVSPSSKHHIHTYINKGCGHFVIYICLPEIYRWDWEARVCKQSARLFPREADLDLSKLLVVKCDLVKSVKSAQWLDSSGVC